MSPGPAMRGMSGSAVVSGHTIGTSYTSAAERGWPEHRRPQLAARPRGQPDAAQPRLVRAHHRQIMRVRDAKAERMRRDVDALERQLPIGRAQNDLADRVARPRRARRRPHSLPTNQHHPPASNRAAATRSRRMIGCAMSSPVRKTVAIVTASSSTPSSGSSTATAWPASPSAARTRAPHRHVQGHARPVAAPVRRPRERRAEPRERCPITCRDARAVLRSLG